jgi:multidrug efflux system outer membrane protein
MKLFIAAFLTLTFFSACAPVGPDYGGPPKVGHSAKFAGGTKGADLDKWWRKLGSRELNGLIDDALDNNYDIAIAAQRLREARAMRKQAASAILPHADGSFGYSRQNPGSIAGASGGLGPGFNLSDPIKYWNSGIDISWEVDVFGGRRREARGARAREQAAQEELHGVRQALVAEVAETYFTIAGLREQLTAVESQVSLQQKQTDDTRNKADAGASSQLDLDRSRARLETTRAEIPTLQAGITTQIKRLALILGQRPDALDRKALATRALPNKLPMTRTGLPAELVLRRPDLRQSERELAAATEDIGVATSNFYPKVLIGATGPTSIGAQPADLFNAGGYVWQFGPKVQWSLFQGGANRAALEKANARQKAELLTYEKSVLAAIGEVETELANLSAETQRLVIVQRARRASADAARRVRENHEAGAAPQVEILIEDQALREIEITEIRVKNQMLQIYVRLHKALGGGWN